MKLWILKPIDDQSGPWEPWYDKTFGFIVRAESEEQARVLAAEQCGDEGPDAWLDESLSTCIELTSDGEAGVIIEDNWSA